MAISTYTELQAAIFNYLHRTGDTDLTDRVPEFITLAESRINRDLRLLNQEVESTASYDPADSSRYVEYPAGFIELLDLRAKRATEDDLEYYQINYSPGDRISDRYNTTAGKPRWYTLRSSIEFERLPDVIYTLRMHYVKRFDIANDATNWLLTNHPGVYLYGSLVEAEPYLVNDARIKLWAALYKEAWEGVDDSDQRNRDDETLDTRELSRLNTNRYYYDINHD